MCAACMGLVDVLTKRALQEFEPGVAGVARLGFALPLLFASWWVVPWPALSLRFWLRWPSWCRSR